MTIPEAITVYMGGDREGLKLESRNIQRHVAPFVGCCGETVRRHLKLMVKRGEVEMIRQGLYRIVAAEEVPPPPTRTINVRFSDELTRLVIQVTPMTPEESKRRRNPRNTEETDA